MDKPIDLLLIEDHVAEVRLLREMLKQGGFTGFELTHAPRVGVALDHLSRSSFDLIVMDLSLPDARGYEAFSRVHDKAADVPIVILSGSSDRGLIQQIQDAGAAAFIDKNEVSCEDLAETLLTALGRRG